MGLELRYIYGQTPLEEDEKEGLLIESITTRGELDEFEQLNIIQAVEWTLSRKLDREYILSEGFIRELHRRMFGDVWSWAGTFRKSNKNIGVDKTLISTSLKQLLENAKIWIDKSVYSEDETAVRLKHGIVNIHCFPNGNGRHSRLMADVVIAHIFNRPVFTWGQKDLVRQNVVRRSYFDALKEADNGNIKPLTEFARS